MKVLVIHNTYQQHGGEDAVVAAEEQMLADNGHTVFRYRRDNDALRAAHPLRIALTGAETIWASSVHRDLQRLISQQRPDVAHFHNTFPLISPAAYYACAAANVPVVQTLHNYRLLCPAATFLRDGAICESCLGRSVTWPSVVHGCYRGSRSATASISTMLATHHVLRTWRTKVDMYIALSKFARDKFVAGGLPSERIIVKPNFVLHDSEPKNDCRDYALYVGRLSEEKGVQTLLAAWIELGLSLPLKIAGDGPLHEYVLSRIAQRETKHIEVLGHVQPQRVLELMQGARILIFPSVCFENFPLAIMEAFACGVPVVASRMGVMEEIVADGRTGLHFTPGDARDLAAKLEWAWTHPEMLRTMGEAARAEYQAVYTAERNYRQLMNIYDRAISSRQKPGIVPGLTEMCRK